MKFYIEQKDLYYRYKIKVNKLPASYYNKNDYVQFYKNGLFHNSKNAAYVSVSGWKTFYLKGSCKGYKNNFTKK